MQQPNERLHMQASSGAKVATGSCWCVQRNLCRTGRCDLSTSNRRVLGALAQPPTSRAEVLPGLSKTGMAASDQSIIHILIPVIVVETLFIASTGSPGDQYAATRHDLLTHGRWLRGASRSQRIAGRAGHIRYGRRNV
jgi:hypothetical protein